MNYYVEKPYPPVRVEGKNSYYAALLLEDYAGKISEESAIHLYLYQFLKKWKDPSFANALEKIAEVEMHHLALLGKTITLLGVDPKFETMQCNGEVQAWTSDFVPYEDDPQKMLELDIRSEQQAILQYQRHIEWIDDSNIQKLLFRIIEDERKHIEIFEQLSRLLDV